MRTIHTYDKPQGARSDASTASFYRKCVKWNHWRLFVGTLIGRPERINLSRDSVTDYSGGRCFCAYPPNSMDRQGWTDHLATQSLLNLSPLDFFSEGVMERLSV
ncbi:hypothetical protein TNCV_3371671 [Trichonephila clavipes]|nr:hypothetical protein TNCV_3371671 [Trichonephila clavipes]